MVLMAGAKVNVGDFGDSGQVSLAGALAAGFTSAALDVSRVGDTVFWEGTIAPTTNWGAANTLNTPIANLGVPAAFLGLASKIFIVASVGGTAATVFRVSVTSGGSLQVRCSTASYVDAVHLSMVYRGAPL
jgi:hypothetical protein